MTDSEILEKAIQKAIDGGWKGVAKNGYFYPEGAELLKWQWEEKQGVWHDGSYDTYEEIDPRIFIFSHDFAKSLWGDKNLKPTTDGNSWMAPSWQLHLQQMVIADEPLKYLGANI